MVDKTPEDIKNDFNVLQASITDGVTKPPKQLEDNIKRFLGNCNKLSDEDWKTKVMLDSKNTIEDHMNRFDEFEEKPNIKQEIESHMRWVVPIPPDPERVAYVIARDRAAYEKEQGKESMGK